MLSEPRMDKWAITKTHKVLRNWGLMCPRCKFCVGQTRSGSNRPKKGLTKQNLHIHNGMDTTNTGLLVKLRRALSCVEPPTPHTALAEGRA